MIKAEIIADSINPVGDRLTTFIVTFPRIILAEVNTHRAFSRNSASSRAIPFKKMVKMVEENPFIPIAWQKVHKGMQGTEYLSGKVEQEARDHWLQARDKAVICAKGMSSVGVTKQLCNRILEPFIYHTAIITTSAEGLENFFKQRCPEYMGPYTDTYRSRKDFIKGTGVSEYQKNSSDWFNINNGQGEIHIMRLAEVMWDVYKENAPKNLQYGEWHIPFGDKFDKSKIENLFPFDKKPVSEKDIQKTKVKISVARCARISYLNFEGKDDYEADIKLHDRLLVEEPVHASPGEHCAEADDIGGSYPFKGNLGNGWIQYRKILEFNKK